MSVYTTGESFKAHLLNCLAMERAKYRYNEDERIASFAKFHVKELSNLFLQSSACLQYQAMPDSANNCVRNSSEATCIASTDSARVGLTGISDIAQGHRTPR